MFDIRVHKNISQGGIKRVSVAPLKDLLRIDKGVYTYGEAQPVLTLFDDVNATVDLFYKLGDLFSVDSDQKMIRDSISLRMTNAIKELLTNDLGIGSTIFFKMWRKASMSNANFTAYSEDIRTNIDIKIGAASIVFGMFGVELNDKIAEAARANMFLYTDIVRNV